MYFYLAVSRYKCVFLTTAILIIFIDSGQSYGSGYILPIIPDTHYTLNDLIILPENSDVVEITIVSMNTSLELYSLNVTTEHEFRLEYGTALLNLSLESGLQIITSCKTTVVIDLPGGVLKLPAISDYGNIYHLPTLTDNAGTNLYISLVMQSEVPDTFFEVCGINNGDKIMTQNFKQTSKGDNNTNNCSRSITSSTGRYFLNVTIGFPRIEITSEHPILILQGHVNPSPNSIRRKQKTPYPLASQIHWQAIPPLSKKTEKIILLPSENRREYTFRIVSPVNSYVDFQSIDNLTTINLTANQPINKSFAIPSGSVLTVTSKYGYTLNCVKSYNTECNDEIISINVESMFYNSSSNTDNRNEIYIWIYISNDTTPFILVPYHANVTVKYLNGQITEEEIVEFNISNSFLILKSFARFPKGLYKISVHKGFDTDLFFYVPKQNVDEFKGASAFNRTPSVIFAYDISAKSSEKTSIRQSVRQSVRSTPYTSIVKESTQTNKVLFSPKSEEFSQYTLEATHSTVDKSTESSRKYEQSTKTSDDFPDLLEKGGAKENIKTDDSESNWRFKAVVDIFHSDKGRRDKLIDKSNEQEDPKYTYKYYVNNNVGQVGDGKNPVAIIASLVSAILAVGAIILIFLLKDFFSRRQNIRKTRIRPFLSYY